MIMKRKRNSITSTSVEFDRLLRIKKLERSTTSEFDRLLRIKKLDRSTTSESEHSLPDDVLYEIFIRLPNLRSAIQCNTVCKNWFSIIKSRSNLIKAALMDRLRSKIQPLTLLFGQDFISGNPIRIDQQKSSNNRTHAATVLNLFPCLNNSFTKDSTTLVATCDDLLLFRVFSSYYVSNPLTGQSFLLPPSPKTADQFLHGTRFGLVSEPNDNNNDDDKQFGCRKRFMVMLMFDLEKKKKNNDDIITCMTMFSSETWQWRTTQITRKNNIFELSSVNYDVVACNGGLYWLGFSRLVAFYPFQSPYDDSKRWRFIDLPHGFNSSLLSDYRAHLRLGLFEGRPRLSRLFSVDNNHLCLEVWDLKYNSDGGHASAASLALVHKVRIEAGDVYVLAFHPSHTNQIFLLRNDCHLYQYDMETNEENAKVAEITPKYYFFQKPNLRVFPFLFPAGPTLIQRVV